MHDVWCRRRLEYHVEGAVHYRSQQRGLFRHRQVWQRMAHPELILSQMEFPVFFEKLA